MISYKFGDVVLVPFPFTDQIGKKKRPAVIVSSVNYNAARFDVVLMAITSQVKVAPTFGEVEVAAWKESGLLKPSSIKPVFATVEKRLVLRQLGKLEAPDRAALQNSMRIILDC